MGNYSVTPASRVQAISSDINNTIISTEFSDNDDDEDFLYITDKIDTTDISDKKV